MTTSNTPVPPPAGGGDPDPDAPMNRDGDAQPDPTLPDQLEGAVPSEDADTPAPVTATGDPDSPVDSVEADKRRTGAD